MPLTIALVFVVIVPTLTPLVLIGPWLIVHDVPDARGNAFVLSNTKVPL